MYVKNATMAREPRKLYESDYTDDIPVVLVDGFMCSNCVSFLPQLVLISGRIGYCEMALVFTSLVGF